MYCCRVAALNEFMQWLSWMFLKDNCTGGGCTESRPLALYVVHSTCAWLLTGIFNCSELTLQSGFFLPESGKNNERKGGRSRSHTRSKSRSSSKSRSRRKRSQSKHRWEFLLSYLNFFGFVFTVIKIFWVFVQVSECRNFTGVHQGVWLPLDTALIVMLKNEVLCN